MELAEGIRKIGFARWYERQLIEGHLYLISSFLCLVVVLACLEGFSLRMPAWEAALRLAAMVAGVGASIWTLRRYLAMLDFAVRAAEHSVCRKCSAYGLLEVMNAGLLARREGAGDRAGAPVSALAVRCRKCGHEWMIG
jgi:ribosomal protein L40E